MRYFIITVLLIITTCLAYGEPIAGFDCQKATEKEEILVCSDDDAAYLDAKLTGLYKLALKVVNPNQSIKKQQVNWLKNIRTKCNDVNCISRVYSERITEISNILNKHTRPIPRLVFAEKRYPNTGSTYCKLAGGDSFFAVSINRDNSSISGYIDGIYDCGRKVWGTIDIKGQVTGNLAEITYEGGFSGEGWAKAFIVLSGKYLYWQIYQELRVESYEPPSETLKIQKQ